MKQGSRYHPLFERLRQSAADEIAMTFVEIEKLLGRRLPPSARAGKAWWSNRLTGAQAAAWMEAGYHVVAVKQEDGRVIFRRRPPPPELCYVDGMVIWDGAAIRALRMHMGLSQTKFANILGVRQQTISEWENGAYRPTRQTANHLQLVAKEAGFPYTLNQSPAPSESAQS